MEGKYDLKPIEGASGSAADRSLRSVAALWGPGTLGPA
jgi:hypothetical protein